MGRYTSLTKVEIKAILSEFSIHDLISFKILSGGQQNTNYLVCTNQSEYVLTICEFKTEQETRNLASMLQHLELHQFQSSTIVPTTTNDVFHLWNKKPIMLKRFLPGKIIQDFSPHLLRLIGIELGKLHQLSIPNDIPNQLSYGKEAFSIVKRYAANSDFDLWLEEILAYLSPYLELQLPKALIHGDVFYDNVIVSDQEDSIVIMDFEEAAYYYRVFDIGMTIIGICRESPSATGEVINLKKAKEIIRGYNQEIQLLESEIESFQAFTVYAGAAMALWRHSYFNYYKPTKELKHHYKELQALTEFVKKIPADEFLDQIQ